MERWNGIFLDDKAPTKLSHKRKEMEFKEMSLLGEKKSANVFSSLTGWLTALSKH